MVVDQLVEWLIPTPEVRGSKRVIGKIWIKHLTYWKFENKGIKEAGDDPLLKMQKKFQNGLALKDLKIEISLNGKITL